ncbi:MAG: N-acetylneuraminate synthase [Alphaproteobacteria bacterium]
MDTFTIFGRIVSDGTPCLIIAEAGVNHNGDAGLAHKLIDAAAVVGADAVKFQTFRTEAVVAPGAPKAAYQRASASEKGDQSGLLRGLELSFDEFRKLSRYAQEKGLIFLSTAFDFESLEFVVRELSVPAIKIPSGEVTNVPYLRRAASYRRPVILSTGMATLEEVGSALEALVAGGTDEIAVLHCVSAYPTPDDACNLAAMSTLAAAFGRPVGFSDHSRGIDIALAARALGAAIIEKHLTLDKALPGPDHVASLEPAEFGRMVEGIRRIEQALGDGRKRPQACEEDVSLVARRSLFLARDCAAGEVLTEAHLIALRPAIGMSPASIDAVTGRRARHTLQRGSLLQWSDLE